MYWVSTNTVDGKHSEKSFVSISRIPREGTHSLADKLIQATGGSTQGYERKGRRFPIERTKGCENKKPQRMAKDGGPVFHLPIRLGYPGCTVRDTEGWSLQGRTRWLDRGNAQWLPVEQVPWARHFGWSWWTFLPCLDSFLYGPHTRKGARMTFNRVYCSTRPKIQSWNDDIIQISARACSELRSGFLLYVRVAYLPRAELCSQTRWLEVKKDQSLGLHLS